MKIVAQSHKDFSKLMYYKMVASDNAFSFKNVEEPIVVGAWVKFEDESQDGNVNQILSIYDPTTGNVYGGTSPSFERAFDVICDLCGLTDKSKDTYEGNSYFVIEVRKGLTKAGREFISCELIDIKE